MFFVFSISVWKICIIIKNILFKIKLIIYIYKIYVNYLFFIINGNCKIYGYCKEIKKKYYIISYYMYDCIIYIFIKLENKFMI